MKIIREHVQRWLFIHTPFSRFQKRLWRFPVFVKAWKLPRSQIEGKFLVALFQLLLKTWIIELIWARIRFTFICLGTYRFLNTLWHLCFLIILVVVVIAILEIISILLLYFLRLIKSEIVSNILRLLWISTLRLVFMKYQIKLEYTIGEYMIVVFIAEIAKFTDRIYSIVPFANKITYLQTIHTTVCSKWIFLNCWPLPNEFKPIY